MMTWPMALIAGLSLGVLLSFALLLLSRRATLRRARSEAQEWIDSAQDTANAEHENLKADFEDYKEEMAERFERDTRKLVERNREMEERLQEKEEAFQDQVKIRQQLLDRKNGALQSRRAKIEQEEQRVRGLQQKTTSLWARYREETGKKSSIPEHDLKEQIATRLEQDAKTRGTHLAQEIEQEAQVNMERDAKRMVGLALNRFARPYCPERGIGNVEFTSPDIKKRVFGEDNKFMKKIEQLCGVDIVFNEEYQSATVMGFDPVRRELGRLTLEGLVREKQINEQKIESTFERVKRDLFKKILNDGNRIAQELRLRDFHEAVRSMLGALRYRYSFAQNQYFHVAEVGWLCGLLSAEMNLSVEDGRRAGVLHDIGKAMDHSKDGGHAVIGAEFIEQHGESPQVVHAVRAHHYDETPDTDLAFLTIAADAISGARPGARRSTVDSYTQKMADLEKIGSSFEGVTATYILSAGREVRVIVDGQHVDDHKALDLSKQIAHKIEEECSYPGLIKVTVVRQTQAVEFAR